MMKCSKNNPGWNMAPAAYHKRQKRANWERFEFSILSLAT